MSFFIIFSLLTSLFSLNRRPLSSAHKPRDKKDVAFMYSRKELEPSFFRHTVPKFRAHHIPDVVQFKFRVFLQEPADIFLILRRAHRTGTVHERPAGLHILLHAA